MLHLLLQFDPNLRWRNTQLCLFRKNTQSPHLPHSIILHLLLQFDPNLRCKINGDNDSWKVKVKVIRLWKQTYSNNPSVLSSIDMVCIDEQGTRIQATVKGKLTGQFDALLEEGGIRVLSKFGVGENKGRFLLTRHPCIINFYRHTTVRLSNVWVGPEQSFELLPFNSILAPNFASVYSFDVIGEVIHCQDTRVMTTKEKESRVKNMQIMNEEGIKMKCSLWGEHATTLDTYLADPSRKDARVIILIQFARLGEWEREPQISNSLFGSKVWINSDIPEFADFTNKLQAVNVDPSVDRLLSSNTVFSNPIDYWLRFEYKKIDELMDIKKETGCVVIATVLRIQTEHPWFYHKCTKCNSTVPRLYQLVDENSEDEGLARFDCPQCGVITDVYPKLKLQLRVQDSTGSISFTLFERDVTAFVNKSVSQIISNATKVEHGELYPPEFNMFVGKRFGFKIKVSPYNINNNYNVYTVNRLTDEEKVIENILKNSDADEDATDYDSPKLMPPAQQVGLSAKDAVSGTNDNITPLEAYKSTASSPGSKKRVEHDDGELVVTGSTSRGRPDLHKLKIPKLEKF